MSYRTAAIVLFAILLMGSAIAAADKQTVRVEWIGDVPAQNIFLAPSLVTADTCFVSDNEEITTRIDGWVVGFELYKSLMNPAHNCEGPYPYTITAVNMPMIFDAATPITVASDIEAVDSTTVPGCTVPGVLLAVSSEWEATVPSAGLYNIWVPLDSPLVVDGPFFAGFYIGNTFDPAVNAAVLIDENPVACATFNIWDETIGWVDLVNNDYYNFPGRLAMEVSGIPGGGGGSTDPEVELVTPADGDQLYANRELWAWDRNLTGKVEYIIFEYSSGGPFIEIGRDFDGTSPLRDGLHPIVAGNGFSVNWDFSSLPEGYYDVRATLVDTLGASVATTINVYLEPTPPTAEIVSPAKGTAFCTPVHIEMSSSDENLSVIEVQHRQAGMFTSLGISPMSQWAVGDSNGDPNDGNRASNGEYGDYYSAPTAAAMAAAIWSDRGFPGLVKEGAVSMTTEEVAEEMAAAFMTRRTLGTYDEAVLSGLTSYSDIHGGGFAFEHRRNPDYSELRIWAEDEERVVLLALGDNPGMWVTVDGFSGWARADTSYLVNVANPLTGNIESGAWRDRLGYSEISLRGNLHKVDLMVSMLATGWNIARPLAGADFSGDDGWSVNWAPAGLIDGSYHYLRSIGLDDDNNTGPSAVLAQFDCSSVYVPGDYDNDRTTTIADLFRLIAFIAQQGETPSGGAERADCNCDNVINVTDIIYYMNFLYGTASPPCR